LEATGLVAEEPSDPIIVPKGLMLAAAESEAVGIAHVSVVEEAEIGLGGLLDLWRRAFHMDVTARPGGEVLARHDTQSFSPLAVLLPEKTTPELLYLETKWASLASYGMSVKMFEDVLPLDEPLHTVTIRNHVLKIAERLEVPPSDCSAIFHRILGDDCGVANFTR